MNSFSRFSSGLTRPLGPLHFDFSDSVGEIVGHSEQFVALILVIDGIRLPSVQQAQVRHRIIVVCSQLDGAAQRVDSFINCGTKLPQILLSKIGRKRILVSDLFFATNLGVVTCPQIAIRVERKGPVHHANPVVRFRILGLKPDVLPKTRPRFLELGGIIRLTPHLEKQQPDSVKCGEVLWIDSQYFPKSLERRLAAANIRFTLITSDYTARSFSRRRTA
jgi:hypothetical protein